MVVIIFMIILIPFMESILNYHCLWNVLYKALMHKLIL